MNRTHLACLVAALAVASCGGSQRAAEDAGAQQAQETAAPGLPADVTLAVDVARAIEANPAASDSILAARGLTRAGLDSLMVAIATDSTKAAAYSAALR